MITKRELGPMGITCVGGAVMRSPVEVANTERLTAREGSGDPRAHGARVTRPPAAIAGRSGHRNGIRSTATATQVIALLAVLHSSNLAFAQAEQLPRLTQPVHDFAHVIDFENAAAMDRIIRALQTASGDVIVVVTVDQIAPFADIREYAVKLFENHGAGIGEKGKDNGLLVLMAVGDRRVWIEVGYDLEPIITDGFAGETSRQYMAPEFRNGRYGEGLRRGVERLVGRIAQARDVTIDNVAPVQAPATSTSFPIWPIVLFIVIVLILASRAGRPPRIGGRRMHYWGGSPWSGWNSGVGSFGGGFGGRGGGGFGGGFGGFGGGRSGGGGGGGSW